MEVRRHESFFYKLEPFGIFSFWNTDSDVPEVSKLSDRGLLDYCWTAGVRLY